MQNHVMWTAKCSCGWEVGGYSVKSYIEDEVKRHKQATGCK